MSAGEGQEALAQLVMAAAADAIVEKKISQFKIALFLNSGPKFVRIVVMPEDMERNWPLGAPLGSKSKNEGQ